VQALLGLSIVDPACGSGHFLLAAARRLAAHVARLQANGTPSGAEYRHALRQVVGKCIYGVDLNPMAVELCKVSLWMEAVEPGLPLTFLNSHVQHGNALLGTTPDLMAKGIPDAAWEPIEGDDRKVASALKKRNKLEAGGQRGFDTLWAATDDTEAKAVTQAVHELEAASDDDAADLARKEARWDGILISSEYRRQKFVADAWCLDGFAPSRNPEMWSSEAMALVAARSRVGTTVATYSAASAVGERLAAAGFAVARPPGALGKREMLVGTLARDPDRSCLRPLPRWFATPGAAADPAPRSATVIGAGLAGAAAARALAERGLRVTVLDARAAASGASGAPRAVLAPHLASWQSPQTRLVAAAFLHARALMDRVGVPHRPCGLLSPVSSDDEWAFEQAIADWGWPASMLRLLDADAARAHAGTPVGDAALLVADACTTAPHLTVRALLAHPGITLHEHAPVARLHPRNHGWTTELEDGRAFESCVAVIATAGIPAGALADMPEALASDALPSVPLSATRGQLSQLAFEGAGDIPRCVVSANGFVMPPVDGTACVGATFERERLDAPPTPHDDALNLGHAERLLPALAACTPSRRGAWAGIRTSVHDHCPVVGPVVADAAFRAAFERLAHGPVAARWPDPPLMPGLFVTLAHGSRGTCTALLAGELIADLACDTPRCVGDDLLPAILPQRFLVRELRTATRGS
jgi:tRNA U-34 5-methylaminomethyl-2-thiouridine biosynthesis protein MnmC